MHDRKDGFTLVVILFILLIIVGCACFTYGGY
ncbi:YjcZ family sporulation protein [Halalkalibacterium halodurans]|nr:YjcZ family sporulation protein [Halalkalibacterium halodurans]MED3647077.1 YjcZ family sporulation protein [Halalkalibacterium halodurans]MED4125122.1 YjcZ family sporulation protein [Halalkalibacterium halodurans]MED4165036.1 YjcZ family sporulation protein [Halalkalibacterium halodurans]MED4172798.1 YjcZ family sporulation protein [Halalkalibacterium halodurans]TES53912.1 YjcZ family sporulation protein [Halalkalibacterium halodurans]